MDSVAYILFAAALAPLLIAPGWLWLRRCGVEPLLALYGGLAATVAAAAAITGLAVVLPWEVRWSCLGGLVLMLLTAAWCALTAPRPLLPERRDLAGVAVLLVAYGAIASFSAMPSHPWGNWGPATVGPDLVYSPRWPGMPSDNLLNFRTGQVVLHKRGGTEIRDRYAVGWWLSDRTPLPGLVFAFTAGALGVHVEPDDPTVTAGPSIAMAVKDDWGYWAYQLSSMLLNLAIVLGVYVLARVWLRDWRLAFGAALLTAVLPGLFLNAIYPQAKQTVAYFTLMAAACALSRRPLLTGGCAALAYLSHPSGMMWAPAALLLLYAANPAARERWLSTLVRFGGAFALLALPWQLFTSQVMHATSRLSLSPLGAHIADPEDPWPSVTHAWDLFREQGLLYALWVRVQSTAGSLFPQDLFSAPTLVPGGSGYGASIGQMWTSAHGISVWGMVGIVLFVPIVLTVARRWPELRLLFLWFLLPGLLFVEVWNGFAFPFSNQSMYTVVGVLAICGAMTLRDASARVRLVLWCGIAFELLTVVYGVLYEPFNISTGARLLFTIGAVGGHLALLVALGFACGLFPPLRRPQRVPRGATFDPPSG